LGVEGLSSSSLSSSSSSKRINVQIESKTNIKYLPLSTILLSFGRFPDGGIAAAVLLKIKIQLLLINIIKNLTQQVVNQDFHLLQELFSSLVSMLLVYLQLLYVVVMTVVLHHLQLKLKYLFLILIL
jgi:hypothetical protein